MESKQLIIVFIWIFVLATLVILYLEGSSLEFIGYIILFIIALGSTVAVETMISDKK